MVFSRAQPEVQVMQAATAGARQTHARSLPTWRGAVEHQPLIETCTAQHTTGHRHATLITTQHVARTAFEDCCFLQHAVAVLLVAPLLLLPAEPRFWAISARLSSKRRHSTGF